MLVRLIRILLVVRDPLRVYGQDRQSRQSDIREVKTEWEGEQGIFVFVGGSYERVVHGECHDEEKCRLSTSWNGGCQLRRGPRIVHLQTKKRENS